MYPIEIFQKILRPKILMQAAKIGLQSYRREIDLKKILGARTLSDCNDNISQFSDREIELEEARKSGNAAYDMNKHIQIMTALLQELYLLPKTRLT